MLRLIRLTLLVIGIGWLGACTLAQAQLDQLALRIPETANALVVIDVERVYASPLAQSQGWGQQGLKSHEAGITALPADAKDVVLAAEIDFELMRPFWEIAVAGVRRMPSMQDIAERSGGRRDRLAGVSAVERPNDSFVVALGPKVIGAMSPANRQHVIRWVRTSQRRKEAEVSPFLAKTLQSMKQEQSQIVLALDLTGILAPAEVADILSKDKSLPAVDKTKQEKLADLVASVEGLRFEVILAEQPQGRLTIHFGQPADLVEAIAKPLLLSVLSAHGANIEDLKQWTTSAEGQTIAMQGGLSESGLRRVLSVLSSPVGPMAHHSDAGSTSEAIAEASQRYFQSVTHYLDDLFASDFRPQSMFQAKTWLERYTRKIGDLDTHQVDQDVLAYGQQVMDYLAEITNIVDRTQRRSDLRETFLYEPGRRRFNRYGAYGGYIEKPYVARDRAIAQADEASLGLEQVDAVVRDLRTISAETRSTMTERYGRQF